MPPSPVVTAIDPTRLAAMLAHQGGWDEFLWVAVPIVAVFALLRVAGRRARSIESERTARDPGPGVSRSD